MSTPNFLARFLARRAITSLITFFAIITLVFFLARLTGDPLAELENDPRISPETIQAIRARFGLDKPLHEQYILFIKNFFRGELGYSLHYGRPVMTVILEKLPYTLALLVPSITLSNFLAYKIGVEVGWRRGTKADVTFMTLSIIFRSVPYFWLAMLFLYAFGVKLGLFPLFGATSPGMSFSLTWEWFKDYLWHYTLPFTVLVVRATIAYVLYVRNSVIDLLGEDYVWTAHAKGMPLNLVKSRYVARNAMLPIITLLGLRYAFLIDGAILTETVFSYPGTGRLVFEAIYNRDFWLLQGVVVILAASVIVANFIIDLVYALLDPRVRLR
ncbi:MAG: ABC transporter permease [Thermoproteota archaeon]